MIRRSKTIPRFCLMAGLGAGATAVWSIDEATTRRVAVVNHATTAGSVDEAVSRTVTVVNHASPEVVATEAISRSVTVVNHAVPTFVFTESISRAVTVCNNTEDTPDSDGDGVNDCADQCPGCDDHIDADADGVPDGCPGIVCDNCVGIRNPDQGDCDRDGRGDACEIALDGAADCTRNGIPDICEPDCNGNGVADSCDLAAGLTNCCGEGTAGCVDCNLNDIPDCCDIAPGGQSSDANGDGVPDECLRFDNEAGTSVWSDPFNWDDALNLAVPNNTAEQTFSATIDGATADVVLDLDATVDTLRVADQATLRVTAVAPDNLTVVRDGGLTGAGTILVASNRTVTVSDGPFRLDSDGRYEAEPGAVDVQATLTAASVLLDSPNADESDGGAARMILTDRMTVQTAGDFVIRANAAAGPYLCAATTSNVAGGVTPPVLKIKQRAALTIGGDFTLIHAAAVESSSTAPTRLAGDFVNQSVYPTCFKCLSAHWKLDGTDPQTFEAAGEDRGRWVEGLVDNFALGTLELDDGASVTVVDVFDNQRDGVAACDEALYVQTLVLGGGAVLRTAAGCRVYFGELVDFGGVLEGTFIPLAMADFNGDRRVDVADHAAFVACMSADVPDPACLDAFDVDSSGDLTIRDFANLQNLFTHVALADFNNDDRVDAADHAAFVACMAASPPDPPCLDAFDVDLSGDLTLRDFANLQNLFAPTK